ncbi:MAG TPA: hypothetical protein VJN93_02870 [Candidatus Acidoferrum sp.]|nr:hypothetical protein [Candidatus Acidoferrum sp.]
MKKTVALALALFLSYGIALADSPKDADAKPAQPAKPATPAKPKAAKAADKSDSAIAAEIEELRQAVQAQQEQLQLLKEELAKRDHQIDEAREAAAAANARASDASSKAVEAVNTTAEVKSTADTLNTKVADLSASNAALKTEVAAAANESGAGQSGENAPASIRFKGITITPGGFIAAETVFRRRGTGSDVNTPFNSIPFPNNSLSQVSEFNAGGRQSRLSVLFEGKADNTKLSGYYEMDWLGACVTSNNRQSNSYCLRQRQLWGQAALSSGWIFTGGQMWSLATETKKGLDNRTENLPMTIDSQYHVGFTWERQYGFRVTKNIGDKTWVGFAAEEPQSTVTASGQPTSFILGSAGNAGGLYNSVDGTGYALNKTPDFIVKAAFEPGFGHYEIFGIISDYRDRVFPCSPSATTILLPAVCNGVGSSAASAFNDSRVGGGIGVNLRMPVVANKVDFGIHFIGGDGIGRYSSAQLPDVTVRPNGTLAPIRGGGGLGTLELHPNSKLDIYFNYGVEYAYRTDFTYTTNPATGTPATVAVGYGSPYFNNSGCELSPALPAGPFTASNNGTCSGNTRNIQEATIGFWHKIYNGPKGGLRWGLQYSYFNKNSWSGNNSAGNISTTLPGINGKAVDNMFWTSFRYYVP